MSLFQTTICEMSYFTKKASQITTESRYSHILKHGRFLEGRGFKKKNPTIYYIFAVNCALFCSNVDHDGRM